MAAVPRGEWAWRVNRQWLARCGREPADSVAARPDSGLLARRGLDRPGLRCLIVAWPTVARRQVLIGPATAACFWGMPTLLKSRSDWSWLGV